jgi:hypothetical protein
MTCNSRSTAASRVHRPGLKECPTVSWGHETQSEHLFCTSDDGTRIAVASCGEGPVILRAAHWLSYVDYDLESLVWRSWLQSLSARNRFVRYDPRGVRAYPPHDSRFPRAMVRPLSRFRGHMRAAAGSTCIPSPIRFRSQRARYSVQGVESRDGQLAVAEEGTIIFRAVCARRQRHNVWHDDVAPLGRKSSDYPRLLLRGWIGLL